MTLNMVHLPVSQRALLGSGRDHGLVRSDWSVEPGYLVHALFARLFAEDAPRPFDIQESRTGMGDVLPILAYTSSNGDRLRARAASAGAAAKAIGWSSARTKPMPGFGTGLRLGFRVRTCPIIRVGRQHPRFAPGAEVDPYLAAVQRQLALAGPFGSATEEDAAVQTIVDGLPSRECVYIGWLRERLGSAVELEWAQTTALRDVRLWRKGAPGLGAAKTMHGRDRAREGARSVIARREVVFEGKIRVLDGQAFADLLARGIGRHRSFGFGMLLLRPC